METILNIHATAVDYMNIITGHLNSTSPDSKLRQSIKKAMHVANEAIQELQPSNEERQSFLDFLTYAATSCTEKHNEFAMVLDFLKVRGLPDPPVKRSKI